VPFVVIVPVADDPPETPFTFQTGVAELPPPLPVAVNCTLCPASTSTLLGDRLKFAGCSKEVVELPPPQPSITAAAKKMGKRMKNCGRLRTNEIPPFAVPVAYRINSLLIILRTDPAQRIP
jgi:hypothetical protein